MDTDKQRYPITLTNLVGKLVLVVGGGPVGERKIRSLLPTGAHIRLISPQATDQLQRWAAVDQLDWRIRTYQPDDLDGVMLVYAATNVRAINAQIAADTAARGLLCNVADAPHEGTFHVPAVHRQDEIIVAVSTQTAAPRRAVALRNQIATLLHDHSPPESTIAERSDPPRAIPQPVFRTPRSGKAYLVGAGPGRADLITVRGLRLLQQADVVIYDRLIAQELLEEVRPDAELIFAGKKPDRHFMRQEQINAVLVGRVRSGQQVVRLKGGDPFVFGRGGEEALALAAAGLPFEIVPGISSAIAAPAYAGVPVTQRHLATGFAVVTGHEDPTRPDSMTDWDALARVGTLVILMGIRRSHEIVDALIGAGRAATTPVVIVSHATTDQQQVVAATLSTLPAAIASTAIEPPAVIIVGDVAGLREDLAWFQPDGSARGFIEGEGE